MTPIPLVELDDTVEVEPTQETLQEVEQETSFLGNVLKLVNKIRGKHGKDALYELPQGVISSGSQCVLARAFVDFSPDHSVWVDGQSVDWYDANGNFRSFGFYGEFEELTIFVDRFDDGEYPELTTYEEEEL